MRFNVAEVPVPDFIRSAIYNNDPNATLGIPSGTPVVLQLTASPTPPASQQGYGPGASDGLMVVLPSTAGPTMAALAPYGIANVNLQPNVLGEVTLFGIVNAKIGGQTRSASTVPFAATTLGVTGTTAGTGYAPVAASIDTVNNVLTSMAAVAGVVPNFLILDQVSASSVASNSTNTSLINPVLARVFVRLL
jgi:hypothetical protein